MPVSWHQDPPYGARKPGSISDERPETYIISNIDADIYLDRATVDNGSLWIIPEHHLVGHVEYERYCDDELFDHSAAIPVELEPGDVNFHSLSAPHGSRGNRTDTLRRTFYIHYVNEQVHRNVCSNFSGGVLELRNRRGLFTQEGIAYAHRMVEARKELGWSGLDGCDVEMTNEGFEFVGEPRTPPRYWEKIIREMTEEQMAQKRSLQPTVS